MQHLADFSICERAVEFINGKIENGNVSKSLKKLGIPKKLFYSWKSYACVPSTYYLQKLSKMGADMNYIIAGIGNGSI